MNIKPIETEYNGYRFRSRLEARWAVFFDCLGIEYEYEPEGFELENGVKYLPDFYLPESKTFFEVKGEWRNNDAEKVELMLKNGIRIAVGYNVGEFQAPANFEDGNLWLVPKYMSALIKCENCGKYWFLGDAGNWTCPCCGIYDGNTYLDVCLPTGDGGWQEWGNEDVKKAITIARQARFEHGEHPLTEREDLE